MANYNLLVAINAGTLIAIITIGYKIITYLNTIKFKIDLMWVDYENDHNLTHVHRRISDIVE